MTDLLLEPVHQSGFSLVPSLECAVLGVRLTGTGDLDAIETLSGYLPHIHQQAVTHEVEEVRFDFRELEFMNSSCFKAFVTFIDTAKTLGATYRICFMTTTKHYWQRRSLEALRRLAMGLVVIQSDQ